MHFRALTIALTALLLLALAQSAHAVPTVPLTASRGLFDIFSSSTTQPTPTASPTFPPTPSPIPTSVADLADLPLDTEPEDEDQPSSDTNPAELAIPTETPQPEEESMPQTEADDSQPDPTPVSPIIPDDDSQDTTDPLLFPNGSDSDAKAADPRSSGATQLLSTASSGISVLALVAVAVAILAPALLIYWGIRRRRAAGFNAMPPTTSDNSTYQPTSQFSVGE